MTVSSRKIARLPSNQIVLLDGFNFEFLFWLIAILPHLLYFYLHSVGFSFITPFIFNLSVSFCFHFELWIALS